MKKGVGKMTLKLRVTTLISTVKRVLEDAGLKKSDVDDVRAPSTPHVPSAFPAYLMRTVHVVGWRALRDPP